MKKIKPYSEKTYGVTISKVDGKTAVFEEYQNNDVTIKLPLGELLFNIIEAIDFLNKIAQKSISMDDKKTFDEYFYSKEYNLEKVFTDCVIDIVEIKRLCRIRDFLNLCAQNKERSNHNFLKSLTMSVLPREHEFNCLFGKTSKYKIRQLRSKVELPFGSDTFHVDEHLNKLYNEYSFYTKTRFQTLSELCILSLYEIFDYGQIVRQCSICKRYFISDYCGNFCNRPASENDYRGCLKFQSFLYNRDYRSREIIKEYKRIYNKLQSRAKSKLIFDIKNFEAFKTEWSSLNKKIKNDPDKEKLQRQFLKSERWI